MIIQPRVFDDDRGRRTCDIFAGTNMPGDINITYAYPGRITAWHRHKNQTDSWHVVKGSLKVGLLYEDGHHEFVYLHEHDRKTLQIPPGVWHGWMVLGEEECVLMYYIDGHYNQEQPDEERMTVEEAGVDWSVKIK